MKLLHLITIISVVLPLRNGHYYDALQFLENSKDHFIKETSHFDAETQLNILKERIADRSVAAEIDVEHRTFACLKCGRLYPAAITYLIHSCTYTTL